MTRKLAWALAALPIATALPAAAQPALLQPTTSFERPVLPPRPETRFDPAALPDPGRVLALLDYTALAQIDALATQPLRLRNNAIREPSANWVAAAFYTGAAPLVRGATRDARPRL